MDVREQIAEALRGHQQTRGMRVSMGWTCACGWWSKDQSPVFIVAHQADVLVPLVERIAADAKVEALEQFSVELAELRISLPNSTGSYRKASVRAWKRAAELRSHEPTP